jgi:hypothetical protein
MWQIVQVVIEKFKTQSNMNFEIVKINDIAYEEFFNLSIYESIREILFENNKMLILYLLNKRSRFIAIK